MKRTLYGIQNKKTGELAECYFGAYLDCGDAAVYYCDLGSGDEKMVPWLTECKATAENTLAQPGCGDPCGTFGWPGKDSLITPETHKVVKITLTVEDET